MPKRLLNVEFSGTKTRVNVTDYEGLGEVQLAVKNAFGIDVAYAYVHLYDQQGQQISDFDDVPGDYFRRPKNGGLFLAICISPPPTRVSSGNPIFAAGSTSFLSSKQDLTLLHRIEVGDLTSQMKAFASARLIDGCIQSQNHAFLPYPQAKIKKLYVRKCYRDVFDLLIQEIEQKMESFAVSGTPGIGKSLFFLYILYRLMKDYRPKTLCLKPNQVVYQIGSTYVCFDLQHHVVTELSKLDAALVVRQEDTFYVIDGHVSDPLVSSCIALFISSPRSKSYKEFVKQTMAMEWYFPVWTLFELQTCHRHCYLNLPIEMLQERYRVYGGVARIVFHKNHSIPVLMKMLSALCDVDAVRGVKYVGETTNIFPSSHILLQIMVGLDENENAYQFINLDVASEYVGEQLWIRHSAQMVTNLQEMFGGSPNEISRHLFEIYGHRTFSVGGQTLKCRCLESGTVAEITMNSLLGQRLTFGKDTIPTTEDLMGKYYEATDDKNFPAIDSLSIQGMFQFTVADKHPIRGVDILQKLCNLYVNPKLFFVVPPHRFADFKKQKFMSKAGTNEVNRIPKLEQYVIELPVIQ